MPVMMTICAMFEVAFLKGPVVLRAHPRDDDAPPSVSKIPGHQRMGLLGEGVESVTY
jgi:hypothetical protein